MTVRPTSWQDLSGAGNAERSTFPVIESGSASRTMTTAGIMGSGSVFLRKSWNWVKEGAGR